MRTTCLFAFFIVTIVGCGPKNEEVTDEQVDTGAPVAALDTVANTRKDAVRTDENDISPTLPLPQPVIALLSDKYPGWEQPELTPEAKQAAQDQQQDPTLVRGGFNEDTRQDIALQLKQNDDVIVVALLEGDNGNWQTYELKREKLRQQNGNLQSPVALSLREKGQKIKTTSADEQQLTLPHDAVALTQNGRTTVYLFRNGSFSNYSLAQ